MLHFGSYLGQGTEHEVAPVKQRMGQYQTGGGEYQG